MNKELLEILESMENGNWSDAIESYKEINPTGQEYGDFLSTIEDTEQLRDLALLGFYARDYNYKMGKRK